MPRRKSDCTQPKISGQKFGSRLREVRKAKAISEQKFADMIGVQKNYIHQLEKGDRVPSFDTLVSILKVLDISADILMRDYLNVSVQAPIRASLLAVRIEKLSADQQNHLEQLLNTEIDYLEKIKETDL